VTLLYFWLDSIDLAIERVKTRVLEGGHNIPKPVIKRRYFAGIKNLFEIYIPISDYWLLIDNSYIDSEIVAEGYKNNEINIKNNSKFEIVKGFIHYEQ